jgi:hypothetical protein
VNTYAKIVDVFPPEEWESDPFGCAASLARMAARFGLAFSDAMNDTEANILRAIVENCS